MTITGPDARSAAPGQAVVDAAMLVLERMGLTPADLLAAPQVRLAAPTFAEYIPVVSALVGDGCRRAYGSYWNRVAEQWGERGIDEPTRTAALIAGSRCFDDVHTKYGDATCLGDCHAGPS